MRRISSAIGSESEPTAAYPAPASVQAARLTPSVSRQVDPDGAGASRGSISRPTRFPRTIRVDEKRGACGRSRRDAAAEQRQRGRRKSRNVDSSGELRREPFGQRLRIAGGEFNRHVGGRREGAVGGEPSLHQSALRRRRPARRADDEQDRRQPRDRGHASADGPRRRPDDGRDPQAFRRRRAQRIGARFAGGAG